ncbi:MAG: prolyl oligopeptidase family serine peptidase [Bacteroidetes bacterium]|nr:prolyl oligopeptidase family serine peptidase [Bacteroidota bacterium]
MKKLFLFALPLVLSITSMAQKPMEPADLFRMQRIGSQACSPNGEMLVFLVTTYNVEENKGTRRAEMINLLTGEQSTLIPEEYNPSELSFTPDGTKLGFISSKSGSAQLWEYSFADKTFGNITDIDGGIHLFRYDPSGKNLLVGRRVKMDQKANEKYSQFPKTEARVIDGLMYRHWNQWSDYSYNHLFVMAYARDDASTNMKDILEGEKYHSPTMPFGGAEEVCFSPDGKKIYYTCKKLWGTQAALSTNTDIYEYTIESGKTRDLTTENKGYDKAPSFSPDGSKMAWLSMERAGYESDKNRIMVMDMKKGKTQDITENFKYSADGITWSADGSEIYFFSTIEATEQICAYNFKTGAIRQMTQGVHNYTSIIVPRAKSPYLIAGKMSMSQPVALYKVDMEGKDTPLESINEKLLSGIKMGKVEKRMIKTTDDREMLTWVIYPPNFNPNKKYPTLLYCQGGPQSPVSQFFSYRWNFQMMASQGYIVVAPNRRGLPGFGQEWNDEIGHDYGGQPMKDLLSAIDEMAKEPFVDQDKLGAVGASFGGYSVYWLAGNHNKRFKVFISHCGMFNMESWYGSTEELFFANYDNGPYWQEANKENYKKNSPHQYVDKWDTPILIIHNELDFRVPMSEGMQAFTAAQEKMIPSKFLYFPDEGHWVNKPQNALLWQTVFFEWLEQWLK